MARPVRRDRVHSALAQWVNVIEAKEVSAHAGCPRMSSGQLPFLGLKLLALGGALLDTLVHEVVVRRCFVQEEAVPDPVGEIGRASCRERV